MSSSAFEDLTEGRAPKGTKSDAPFDKDMNRSEKRTSGCLNLAAVTNGADIDSATYVACENSFYSWGKANVADQLWLALQDLAHSHGDQTAVLDLPLSADVNYLAQFPVRNLESFSGARVPNPNDWTLSISGQFTPFLQWATTGVGPGITVVSLTAISATSPTAILNIDQTAEIPNPNTELTPNLWTGGANQHTLWRPSVGSIPLCTGGGADVHPGTKLVVVRARSSRLVSRLPRQRPVIDRKQLIVTSLR